MNENVRSFARLGLVNSYLEIAVDCYIQYNEIKKEYDKIVAEGGEWYNGIYVYKRMEDFYQMSDKLRKETIKIIIFLTTFLEAYIYELAGIVLGDKYSKEHLDKLTILSKWIIIPRLITSIEIDRSKSFFSDFKNLIKWRNNLIHHKSIDANQYLFTIDEKKINDLKPIYELVNVSDFFKMVKDLFTELDRIDKDGLHLLRIKKDLDRLNNIQN